MSKAAFRDDLAALLRPRQRRDAPTILFFEELDDEAAEPVAEANPVPPEPPAPVAVEPMPGEAELARARAEGFAHGKAMGEASALAAAGRANAAALAALAGDLAGAVADAEVAASLAREAAAATLARLLLAALSRMLPSLCARHGPAEAAALARAILPGLGQDVRATLRVHPEALPQMQAVVAALDPAARGRLTLEGNEALAAGDLRIEWQDGAAVRDTAAIWAAIGDALAPLGLSDAAAIPAYAA